VADAIDRVVAMIGRVGAWLVLLLVLVITTNVFLRYAFRTGSVWAQELEWHLLAPIVMVGLAYAFCQGEIVRVDFLSKFLPRVAQVAIDLLAAIALLAICIVLVRLSIPPAMQAYVTGEGSPNPSGLPHRFVLRFMLPAGFALLALHATGWTCRAAGDLLRNLRERN
jgi:TRAP-type mannitol/chloroaromatic compound transport system permease small subunit